MHIQTQGQVTAPHTTNQQTNAKAAKQAEVQKQPQKEQTVSLSPKAMALSKQAQLEQKKTEEDKPYQFKNPDPYLDRIINNSYDSNLVQQSLRMTSGSGDSAIYFTDRDRERLKEAYIYADKNGLDVEAVSLTAFRLSDVIEREAMERNGTQFGSPANIIPLKDFKLREDGSFTYRDKDDVLQHWRPGDPEPEEASERKEATWEEYYNSPEYIKHRDEFLEMIKPNPYLQQFVDEVVKAL